MHTQRSMQHGPLMIMSFLSKKPILAGISGPPPSKRPRWRGRTQVRTDFARTRQRAVLCTLAMLGHAFALPLGGGTGIFHRAEPRLPPARSRRSEDTIYRLRRREDPFLFIPPSGKSEGAPLPKRSSICQLFANETKKINRPITHEYGTTRSWI